MQRCGGMEHIELIAKRLISNSLSDENLKDFCKSYLTDLKPKKHYSLDFDVSDLCVYYKLPWMNDHNCLSRVNDLVMIQ